jgi:Helix-turn-helix domain
MNDEGVYMTQKEVNRIEILLKVKNKQMTQTKAAEQLQLSVRHTQRLYKEFKAHGPKALASKKRKKRSNHQLEPIIKRRVGELITCETYQGFGPTFMCETLEKRHRIKISRETTRQMMILHQVWEGKRKKSPVIHQQRQRRGRIGELLQIDGSSHAWFEDRGDRCTLIVFIDDATGRIYCKFVEVETTAAYMKTSWEYFSKYGKPLAFYSDKHGIFRVNQPNCNERGRLTEFGRAAKELGIKLMYAPSPQAKGRVERVNQTLQDRLVKEMRLRNINTMEAANRFLQEIFLDEFNKRFAVQAISKEDAHQEIGKEIDLSEVLSEKYTRKVTKNLELNFMNTIYQIKLQKPWTGLAGAFVTIIKKLNGDILVKYKDRVLPVVKYSQQPHNGEIVDPKEIERFLRNKTKRKVPNDHPWKQERRAEARRGLFNLQEGASVYR